MFSIGRRQVLVGFAGAMIVPSGRLARASILSLSSRHEIVTPFGTFGIRSPLNQFGQIAMCPKLDSVRHDERGAVYHAETEGGNTVQWSMFHPKSDGMAPSVDQFANTRLLDVTGDQFLRIAKTYQGSTDAFDSSIPSNASAPPIPESGVKLDEAMLWYLRYYSIDHDSGTISWRISLSEEGGWPVGLSMAIRLEAVDSMGSCRAVACFIAASGLGIPEGRPTLRFATPQDLKQFLADPQCKIIASGSKDLAWRDVWRDRYWSGTLEVPVRRGK